MRPLLAVLILALPAALAPASHAQPKSLDDLVLAIVNDEPITRGQVAARLMDYQGDEALQRMVNRALLLQAAKKAAVTVSEDELLKRIDEIRTQFKSDLEFMSFLSRNRLSERQYHEEVRHTLILEKIALKEKPITDEDLRQYDVRLAVAPDKATAEKWIKELSGGANFAEIASTRSEDPATRKAAGRMRPFLRIELLDISSAIEQQKLLPGAYTKTPVQLPEGKWAAVKLERMIAAAEISPSERDRLVQMVKRERMDGWMTQARMTADVKTFPLSQAVVATVNGEAVPREQLVIRLLEFQGEEALELMINRALLLQAAKRLSVTVTDEEADKKLGELKSASKKPEEFQTFLSRSNMTEKVFRDQVKYTLLMEKVALKEAPVTEEDLTRYVVRVIVARDRPAAEQLIKDLKDGADFVKTAEERSLDPDGRVAGGLVPPFLKIDLLDVWRAIEAQKLKRGDYTQVPVLLTDASWVIIKFEATLPPKELKPEERTALTEKVKSYRVGQWLAQTVTAARSGGKISRPVPLSAAVIRGS